ncbi:MAG: ATP/GTP-binding protein [Patescibacteria group bacterium]
MDRIAIAGTFSTGKTTLFNTIKRDSDVQQLNYSFIQEVPRLLFEKNNLNINKLDGLQKEWFQRVSVQMQIQNELANPRFIVDYSILDYLAYSRGLKCYHELEKKCYQHFQSQPYSRIFYIPIEFGIEDDGFRKVSSEFQFYIDQCIVEGLDRAGINPIVLTGSVENRMSIFKSYLLNQ